MAQTIIGIFQNSVEAQNARQALLNAGFDNSCIEINDHVDTQDDRLTDGQMTDTTEKADGFSPYPATEEAEDIRSAHFGKKGAIMSIQTHGPDELSQATGILDDYGALDVNEFSEPES